MKRKLTGYYAIRKEGKWFPLSDLDNHEHDADQSHDHRPRFELLSSR